MKSLKQMMHGSTLFNIQHLLTLQLVECNEQKTHSTFWKDWLTSFNKMQLVERNKAYMYLLNTYLIYFDYEDSKANDTRLGKIVQHSTFVDVPTGWI